MSVFGPMPKLALVDGPDCRLRAGGAGMAWPLSAVNLAGREWTVYDLGDNRWSYSVDVGSAGYYIFDVEAPEAYSDTDKGLCQRAAEDIIDTFALIPQGNVTVTATSIFRLVRSLPAAQLSSDCSGSTYGSPNASATRSCVNWPRCTFRPCSRSGCSRTASRPLLARSSV